MPIVYYTYVCTEHEHRQRAQAERGLEGESNDAMRPTTSTSFQCASCYSQQYQHGLFAETIDSEDEEAGELGAPFTEPEHEEEWMDWVNWSAVDAQTGGAGGSSS